MPASCLIVISVQVKCQLKQVTFTQMSCSDSILIWHHYLFCSTHTHTHLTRSHTWTVCHPFPLTHCHPRHTLCHEWHPHLRTCCYRCLRGTTKRPQTPLPHGANCCDTTLLRIVIEERGEVGTLSLQRQHLKCFISREEHTFLSTMLEWKGVKHIRAM